jgi:hypothetical protein
MTLEEFSYIAEIIASLAVLKVRAYGLNSIKRPAEAGP